MSRLWTNVDLDDELTSERARTISVEGIARMLDLQARRPFRYAGGNVKRETPCSAGDRSLLSLGRRMSKRERCEAGTRRRRAKVTGDGSRIRRDGRLTIRC